MIKHLSLVCVYLLVACSTQGQQVLPISATPGQIAFLRHLLITLADPHHDPKVRKLNEDGLGTLYGFTAEESSVVRDAGQRFTLAMQSYEARKHSLQSGKVQMSDADRTALSALTNDLSQTTTAIINQMLAGLRFQTRNLLQLQGDVIETATTPVKTK